MWRVILERAGRKGNLFPVWDNHDMRLVLLSGGVGGARLARGLGARSDVDLTVVVNVGDDDHSYGLAVSPDIDTVLYTMRGVEGPHGWGRAGDTYTVMGHLADLGANTAFQIGDTDLALNLYRTGCLAEGVTLSEITRRVADRLGVAADVLPASNESVRTLVRTADGEWRSFREYFVDRQHRDRVLDVRFEGALEASPAPGVIDAIRSADAVVIAPSNPVLSIWPILAIPGIAGAVAGTRRVIAVSPLFGGEALKGPAHTVMEDLGLPAGNPGVAAAYDGLVNELVIDVGDSTDRSSLTASGISVHVRSTLLTSTHESNEFGAWLVALVAGD